MDYLILILATWRLTSLLVYEDGPYGFLEAFRAWAGVRYDARTSERKATNEPSRALLCVWCTSVWIGAALVGLYALDARALYAALPFAVSAGAIIVDEIINKVKLDGTS